MHFCAILKNAARAMHDAEIILQNEKLTRHYVE